MLIKLMVPYPPYHPFPITPPAQPIELSLVDGRAEVVGGEVEGIGALLAVKDRVALIVAEYFKDLEGGQDVFLPA
jgi:hypothetical protein